MVPFDPRLTVSALSSMRWTFEQDLAYYRRAGLQRVSLWVAKLDRDGDSLEIAGARLAESGIAVDTVCASGQLALSDEGDGGRRQMLAELAGAAEIGARAFCINSGSAHGASYEAAETAFLRRVAPIADDADRREIALIIEGTRPQFAHISFIHTFRQAVEVARRVGAQTLFDSAHFWWETGLADCLATSGDVLGLVQIADLCFDGPVAERQIPGRGELDLRAMLGWVHASGYDGPIEIEVLGTAVDQLSPDQVIEQSARHLGSLLASPGGSGSV
jgi:sugar phosphate isomerase/epimerase